MSQSRRQFLRSAFATGAAAALGGEGIAAPQGGGEGLPRRVLGRTKESVTILGVGCAYAGGGVSEAQTRATIEAALEGGVRYFDAAPEYEQAEVRLGPVLKPVRDKVFVVSKSYALTAKEAEKDLATALKQLQTDHVDLFLQHGVGLKGVPASREILAKGGSLELLRRVKRQGRARFIGMSVHPPFSAGLELLEKADDWDVIMPFLNYVAWAREKVNAESDVEVETVSDYDRLLAKALRDKIGIVGMKVLGGHPGVLADDYDRAVRYALSVPGVACALIGVRSAEEVRRAVRTVKAFRPLTEGEMEQARLRGEEMVRKRTSQAILFERHVGRDLGSVGYA